MTPEEICGISCLPGYELNPLTCQCSDPFASVSCCDKRTGKCFEDKKCLFPTAEVRSCRECLRPPMEEMICCYNSSPFFYEWQPGECRYPMRASSCNRYGPGGCDRNCGPMLIRDEFPIRR
jgi:hypothetical protein